MLCLVGMMQIEIKELKFKQRPLPVVEVFGDTIQGEGPRLRPAIFIRTGMCNLKCEGFGCTRLSPKGENIVGCDTIHAVSPKFKETWQEYTSFSELHDRVKPLYDSLNFKPDIIITGGEPTMHWDNQVFQDMLKFFVDNDFHVTMETNASRDIRFTEDYQHMIQFSMSVKLSNSGEPERKRLNFDSIDNIINNSNESYLKFVINEQSWHLLEPEILQIVEFAKNIDDNIRVYCMPLGETIQKQIQNTRFVFDKCAELGFWFSPRAHILAYDDMDGV